MAERLGLAVDVGAEESPVPFGRFRMALRFDHLGGSGLGCGKRLRQQFQVTLFGCFHENLLGAPRRQSHSDAHMVPRPKRPAANRPAHGTPQQAPGGGTAAHASSRHPSSPGSMRTPHSQHTSSRARIQQAPAYERPPRAAANRSPGIPFSGEVGAKCEQPASHFPRKRHRLLGKPHRTATFLPSSRQFGTA